MSAGIRQRHPTTSPSRPGEPEAMNPQSPRGGLTLQSMRDASPQQTGTVKKLHVSPFYLFLPRFLQTLISKLWILSCLRPYWETRHLILLGSFLYKFSEESQEPKGTPVPVDAIDTHLVNSSDHDDDRVSTDNLPHGYTAVVCVSTLRKNYYYACTSQEEALTWVNSLREARQEAVRRTMGHAVKDSYPTSWAYYDSLGRSLVKTKDRVRKQIEQSSLRELEMSNLTEGGPAPRGYFG